MILHFMRAKNLFFILKIAVGSPVRLDDELLIREKIALPIRGKSHPLIHETFELRFND